MLQGTLTKEGIFTLTKENEMISLFPDFRDLKFPQNSIYTTHKTKNGNTILNLTDDRTFLLAGKEFYFWAGCYDGYLFHIELTPRVQNAPKWPDLEYESEKYEISTHILREILGDPDEKVKTWTIYRYSWGRIFSERVLDDKSPYTGGNINIIYKNRNK